MLSTRVRGVRRDTYAYTRNVCAHTHNRSRDLARYGASIAGGF